MTQLSFWWIIISGKLLNAEVIRVETLAIIVGTVNKLYAIRARSGAEPASGEGLIDHGS